MILEKNVFNKNARNRILNNIIHLSHVDFEKKYDDLEEVKIPPCVRIGYKWMCALTIFYFLAYQERNIVIAISEFLSKF